MPDQPEQPTLTDGEVTLRPWRDEDVAEAVVGHDEVIAHWFGWPEDGVTGPSACSRRSRAGESGLRRRAVRGGLRPRGPRRPGGLCRRHAGATPGRGRSCHWALFPGPSWPRAEPPARSTCWPTTRSTETRARVAFGYSRVEAKDGAPATRPPPAASPTRAGPHAREGERRVEPGTGDRAETTLLRRAEPGSSRRPTANSRRAFRALLNSFLPRKRAISRCWCATPRDGCCSAS